MSYDNPNQSQPQKVLPPLSRSPLADGAQLPEPSIEIVRRAGEEEDYNPDGSVRRPLGRRRAKLDFEEHPGFHRRWLNDVPGRISDALAGGYAHVKENGKPVSRTVGVREQGGGMVAFLMEIPDALWNLDFARKQEDLDEIDAQIHRGTHNEKADDLRYVPSSGIHARVVKGPGRG